MAVVTMSPVFTACGNCYGDMIKVHSRTRYCSDRCSREGMRRSWRKYTARNKAARLAGSRRIYRADPAKRIAQTRAYSATERGKLAVRRAYLNQVAKHPERIAARQAVRLALSRGDLAKSPCACGETKVQAHHEDYSKPLEVRWMCAPCHRAEHRAERNGET